MPDPAEQLQRIYLAGFELQAFERYPNSIGVIRDGCIACCDRLLQDCKSSALPAGAWAKSWACWLRKKAEQVFQAKTEFIEATPERLAALQKLKVDLEELLTATA